MNINNGGNNYEMKKTRVKYSRSKPPDYVPNWARITMMIGIFICNISIVLGLIWWFYELITHIILK